MAIIVPDNHYRIVAVIKDCSAISVAIIVRVHTIISVLPNTYSNPAITGTNKIINSWTTQTSTILFHTK